MWASPRPRPRWYPLRLLTATPISSSLFHHFINTNPNPFFSSPNLSPQLALISDSGFVFVHPWLPRSQLLLIPLSTSTRNGRRPRKRAAPPLSLSWKPPPTPTGGALSPESAPDWSRNTGLDSTSCAAASPCSSAGTITPIPEYSNLTDSTVQQTHRRFPSSYGKQAPSSGRIRWGTTRNSKLKTDSITRETKEGMGWQIEIEILICKFVCFVSVFALPCLAWPC